MRKTFEFEVKGHNVKITNSWFSGAKLYVNGDLKDTDKTRVARGDVALLATNLGEAGFLQIKPLSTPFTVEMDAYLVVGNNSEHVYSSHKQLNQ
ncbi:hypothetical protein D5018_19605 [Parashewanella curva]|uniref:Uncharacterized protein n=1 Tax=Parashewanella curva TaxID=2338552 RepID=A0A3L8PU99_9GAMM|nr:hypothetical protein [Parashewanella curva]RLV57988.1 hypothetical protein D5018_19605 [Parashewanella curva]